MTSGSGRAPTLTVKSALGKPLNVSIEPIELARLMSVFGTAEPGFANLMLVNIINAACDGGSARPPGALAAVSGIGTRDEIEGMLAPQMVVTHFAAMSVLRRLKGSETIPQQAATVTSPPSCCGPLQCRSRRSNAIAARGSRKLRSSPRSCAFRRTSDRRHRPPWGRGKKKSEEP
jgi:hypothetical protein